MFSHSARLILLIIIVILMALALGDVYAASWPLKCPLFQLTGWQCPFCGSQRAVHEALHGHLATAWSLNPALWLAAPWLLAVVAGSLSPRLARLRLVRLASSGRVTLCVLALLLLWGVVRNL